MRNGWLHFVASAAGAAPEANDEPNASRAPDDLSALFLWAGEQLDPPLVQLMCSHDKGAVRAPSGWVTIRLDGCGGDLSAACYLEAAAVGIGRLTVLTDSCPNAASTEEAVAEANRLLNACSTTMKLVAQVKSTGWPRARVYDLHGLPISRRRVLFLGLIRPKWLPDMNDGQRAREIAALRAIVPDEAAQSLRSLVAPSAALTAVGCNACGVCVRSCPDQALHLEQRDIGADVANTAVEEFVLTLSASSCTDCGRCLQLCPSGALERTGQASWTDVVESRKTFVASGAVRRCVDCAANFMPVNDDPRCPTCRFRSDHPFGSYIPGSSELSRNDLPFGETNNQSP